MRAKIRSIAEYDAGGGEARAFGHLDEVAFGFGAGVDEPQVAVVVVTQMQWGKAWWLLHKCSGEGVVVVTQMQWGKEMHAHVAAPAHDLEPHVNALELKLVPATALDVTQTHACNSVGCYTNTRMQRA